MTQLALPLVPALDVTEKPPRPSGLRGVTFHRPSGRWRVRLTIGGKRRSLGYFPTANEAARALVRAVAP